MTKQELFKLGYVRWSDEYPIYLIPLERLELDFKDKNEEVFCINKHKTKIKDVDLDTRYGLLAYGVYPDD